MHVFSSSGRPDSPQVKLLNCDQIWTTLVSRLAVIRESFWPGCHVENRWWGQIGTLMHWRAHVAGHKNKHKSSDDSKRIGRVASYSNQDAITLLYCYQIGAAVLLFKISYIQPLMTWYICWWKVCDSWNQSERLMQCLKRDRIWSFQYMGIFLMMISYIKV